MRGTEIAPWIFTAPLIVACSAPPEEKKAVASQAPIEIEPIVNDKALVVVSARDDLCLVDANRDGVSDVVIFSLWRPDGADPLSELELRLTAIDGLTGATLWRSDPLEPMLFPSVRCADPIIFSFMEGAGSFAFDARTGKLIPQLRGSTSIADRPPRFVDMQTEVSVGDLTVRLRDRRAPMLPPFAHGQRRPMTLSASDLTGERWSHSVGLYHDEYLSFRIALSEDVILVVGHERSSIDEPDTVVGVEAATGVELWKRSFGRAFVVASGPRAYLSTDDVLRKIDPRTGEDEWIARGSNQ